MDRILNDRTARDARLDPAQRGAAMVLVATLLTALLAAGGITLYIQMQSVHGASIAKSSNQALFCAEAGLSASRASVAASSLDWPAILDGNPENDPEWYPWTGDVDGDGDDDYEVTLRDNDDEQPPAALDPAEDSDGRVLIVSTCTKGDFSKQIIELVALQAGSNVYRSQSGAGGWNTGNQNQ